MQYKTLFTRLAEHYGVPLANQAAFRGRIEHFKRLGWPEGANTGKGKPADYTPKMRRDLAFTMELTALGVTPEKAIELVRSNSAVLHAKGGDGMVRIFAPSVIGERAPNSVIGLDAAPLINALEAA